MTTVHTRGEEKRQFTVHTTDEHLHRMDQIARALGITRNALVANIIDCVSFTEDDVVAIAFEYSMALAQEPSVVLDEQAHRKAIRRALIRGIEATAERRKGKEYEGANEAQAEV